MPKPIMNMTQGPNGEPVPINSVFQYGNLGALWLNYDERNCIADPIGDVLDGIVIPIGGKFSLLSWEIAVKFAAGTVILGTTAVDTNAGVYPIPPALPSLAVSLDPLGTGLLPVDWIPRIVLDIPAVGTAVWDKGITIENTTGAVLYVYMVMLPLRAGVANNAATQFVAQMMSYLIS